MVVAVYSHFRRVGENFVRKTTLHSTEVQDTIQTANVVPWLIYEWSFKTALRPFPTFTVTREVQVASHCSVGEYLIHVCE